MRDTDGTLRAICWPSIVDQRIFYSSHCNIHALKFQGIMTPDCIMSSFAGPVHGLVGDWLLWKESGIESCLCSVFAEVSSSEKLDLYSDCAY